MKKTLPRLLSLSTVGVLALAVTACSAQEGVPGLPGFGAAATAPSISVPTLQPLPSVTTTVDPPATESSEPVPTESSDEPFPTESSDDPFPTESTDESDEPFPSESSAAPSTSASSGRTTKYDADRDVCTEAYKASTYYESPSDLSKSYEIYLTRASKLKPLVGKATIPEIKAAITALAEFNQDFGDAYKTRDVTKMTELSKKVSDRSGDYYKSTRLLLTCKYGYELGN